MATHTLHGSEYDINRFVGFCNRYEGFNVIGFAMNEQMHVVVELPLDEHMVRATAREHRLTYDHNGNGKHRSLY